MTKFIIIDDDPIHIFLCELTIKAGVSDAKIDSFTDPVAAFNTILKNNDLHDSIILLDLNMPEMSGWNFIEALIQKEIKVKVHVLTSSINPFDKERISEFPIVKNYLLKPLNVEDVKQL